MDGCSLSDAFGSAIGCTDTKASESQRKHEKRKSKKCRGPMYAYINSEFPLGATQSAVDPDRPALQAPPPVPALNSATGLKEHAPVTQQYDYNEPFVGSTGCLPDLRKTVKGATSLQGSDASVPSFFGASPSDDTMGRRGVLEGFVSPSAPDVDVIGAKDSYRLQPDFTQFGKLTGYAAAAGEPVPLEQMNFHNGSTLSSPNLDMFWKTRGTRIQEPPVAPTQEDNISKKLDRIFARLDDMEHASAENSQTEVLLFIMTGLGVIFLMDVACRAVAK